jgi:hypothetical protein
MGATNEIFGEALRADGWEIEFVNQPPISPDAKNLDLAFFRVIQSLQFKMAPRNMTS